MRRNFGGPVDPPNPEQFCGIYFGGSKEKFNSAGIYFGGSGKKLYLAGINFGGFPEEFIFLKRRLIKKRNKVLSMARKKLPCSSFFTRNGV